MVAGVAKDGYTQALKRRLREAAPQSVIVEEFLGPSQLAELYSKTRMNVHPATYDAYGMTIVEAASQDLHDSDSDGGAGPSSSKGKAPTKRSRKRALVEEDAEDYGAESEEEYDADEPEQASQGPGRKRTRGRCSTGAGGDDDQMVEVDTNFQHLLLKPDHHNRPLWVTPDNRIFLETFSPIYKQAYDFLIAIAEPVCRPESVHEYQLTEHSLYAAVSVGLETETIISVLNRLSKVALSEESKAFIRVSTQNYGKVKLVLKRNKFFVESSFPEVLQELLRDPIIRDAAVDAEHLVRNKALKEHTATHISLIDDVEDEPKVERKPQAESGPAGPSGPKKSASSSSNLSRQGSRPAPGSGQAAEEGPQGLFEGLQMEEDESKEVLSFEVIPEKVEKVKARCLPGKGGLNYPMLEEYDFRNDVVNKDLNIELKPHVSLRPYQEKSLSKMFGNGRARSGIIVLPCGAGKSLVGVAAAARAKKSCLCLCTSSVSVDQWKHQFQLWTNLENHQVARFTSDSKETFAGECGVLITTFTMIAFSGKRSEESEKVMRDIMSREWGLLLLDEVHVVPAAMFRKVISIVHAHCKLGLTATLVREDELIADLNFLIGPKLYEANWLDLTRAGHIANVQCAEVWCPMTKEFCGEYLKKENSSRKQMLYVMNPNKFMSCQFLINYHANIRGDKVIVFSDNIWALKEYATKLGKPFIYGPTSHAERTRVLHAFKHDSNINCVFLSKVGDNSLDIPEANVLIQISSHAGSRRQEAQRLGRILRAKRGRPGSGAEEEFNAFFYTLVSRDTQEMYYSTKRQQFLIDQGYSFKVITNLLEAAQAGESLSSFHYSTQEDQINLLSKVLTAGLEEAGVETLADADADELARSAGDGSRGAGGVKRRVGNMSDMTGASGMRYLEYGTGSRPKGGFTTDKARSLHSKILKKS
ncbi:MAG: hypothetical protein WDW36_003808 [Sanguina aurantia]